MFKKRPKFNQRKLNPIEQIIFSRSMKETPNVFSTFELSKNLKKEGFHDTKGGIISDYLHNYIYNAQKLSKFTWIKNLKSGFKIELIHDEIVLYRRDHFLFFGYWKLIDIYCDFYDFRKDEKTIKKITYRSL